MLKKGVLFFGFLLITIFSFSQSYPTDREKFVKQFQKVLQEYGKGDFHDFAKRDLPHSLLESTDFSNDYFNRLVVTCNLMESKRMDPYPEIYNYVYSVYCFVQRKQSNVSYNAWHSSVDKLLNLKDTRKITDFMEFSAGFFSKNLIAESSNFNWFYYGGSYSFEFTDKPFIRFSGGNLACRVDNRDKDSKELYIDSSVIFLTSGVYDPILKKWEGEKGVVTWEKVGLSKSETNAQLSKYEILLKTSTFSADSVLLTTPYFTKKIMGKLSDRAFKINRDIDKIYPQFISYEKRLTIKNIRPDVDYDGGFSLQGNNFVGVGFPDNPAKMIIYRNASPFIYASSQQFTVAPRRITSSTTGIKLVYNIKDSIYHPGVDFVYDLDKKMVEMTRTKSGVGQSPFGDSYHQLDMFMPKLTWNTESTDLIVTYEIGTSQEQRIARLESKNYFDEKLYDYLQGMEAVHPLVAISKYCHKYDEYTLNEGKIATALNKTIEQAKPLMLELSTYGFISYDSETKMVTVNKKTMNFVECKAGTRDFDNLVFICDFKPKELKGYTEEQLKQDAYLREIQKEFLEKTEKRRMMTTFASISLSTLDIHANAIDAVVISEKQNTIVFPVGNEVTIKQDRNFEFGGWVNCGKMEIDAINATFVYKDFKIALLKTDKSTFRLTPLSEKDGKKPIGMLSSISGIVGDIYVDNPLNKAGISKNYTDFPKLKSVKNSFVYYNSKAILRGAYDSTRFYYTVFPFDIDSLDNFFEKGFHIVGELTSAGIFPKIKQDLVIMPDYSFGFSTKAPPEGYEFYGTKAKYDNKIILSNNGLQGAGQIDFVKSSSTSIDLFNFLPDSCIGYAKFVNTPVESGIQFPDVNCNIAYITYIPKSNLLKAASTARNELAMFKGEAKLSGTIFVRNEGLRGKGNIDMKTAEIFSFDFKFKRWDVDADTAEFNLKNTHIEEGEEEMAFKSSNVKSHISFADRKGEFISNDGTSLVTFPNNQYICKMDKLNWLMDKESIEIETNAGEEALANNDLNLVGPNFFSVHPKQDSLQFRAPKAFFSLNDKTIYCSKVEFIDVADARIYPDSMKLTIRKKAKMDPLTNAKIVANYITQYHKFIKCDLEITARRAYTGKGIYPYYDLDSMLTNFTMDRIFLDSTFQTEARGKIAEDAKFYLSKQFDYYGDVTVKAAIPTIIFTGATRMNHTCEKFPRAWIAFSAKIDPANIQIPIDANMKSIDGKAITSGIIWRDSRSLDSIKLYPTFLSPMADPNDPAAMTASGLLQYNVDAGEFQISSKAKLANRAEKGNYIALHTESCSMNGDGIINLGMDFGEIVKIDAAGTVNYNQSTGKTSINATVRYFFPFDKGLMESIATKINAVEGLKPMEMSSTSLEEALVEWSDRKTADKIKSDYTLKGEISKLPSEMEATITITGITISSFDDVKMQEKGLISISENAVLLNMYEKPVLKIVPIKAFYQQIYSGNGGDKFGLFINIPGGRDYYFDYSMEKKDGLLRVITGDAELEAAVTAIKEDKRKAKNYKYEMTNQKIYLSKFLRLFGGE
ncbi:MAG: hypothetical protein HYR91_09110 [Flavobacteriia bacterium]|nr:hypothetical protein [Flavobacteriia bacterium]